MELWQEVTRNMLVSGEIKIVLSEAYAKVMESRCYQALTRIRDIIRNENLRDEECFMQIEEIIVTLEQLGSDGGIRHDFG